MKFLLTLGLIFLLTIPCFASDINQSEVRPDVSVWRLDTVKFLAFTETAEITYRKGYMDSGNFIAIGGEVNILFQNIEDNPETPEDESSNEFTQLINLINNNDNIKTSVTQAVRVKLGI